ncbi:hypothetical protein DXG01_007027 [Tephrocybe rancida]|nr:hypothetical protein DXG01_007027 [Tephrocybe rancida]
MRKDKDSRASAEATVAGCTQHVRSRGAVPRVPHLTHGGGVRVLADVGAAELLLPPAARDDGNVALGGVVALLGDGHFPHAPPEIADDRNVLQPQTQANEDDNGQQQWPQQGQAETQMGGQVFYPLPPSSFSSLMGWDGRCADGLGGSSSLSNSGAAWGSGGEGGGPGVGAGQRYRWEAMQVLALEEEAGAGAGHGSANLVLAEAGWGLNDEEYTARWRAGGLIFRRR